VGLDILICINDVPSEKLTSQVSSVDVHERLDQCTTYKLNFAVDISDGDIGHSIEKDTSPGKILSVLANVHDKLVCLVKGPVTQQELQFNHGGAGSWIYVEGEDTGHKLDHIPKFNITNAGSDADIARKIIAGSDQMIPDVESTPGSTHSVATHSFVQRESDLSLLRSLARRNGFHFWITYSPLGLATGHFRSRSLDGEAKATLIINERNNNIDNLRVIADPSRPVKTEGTQLDLRTKKLIDGKAELKDSKLGSEGLAKVTNANPQSIHLAPPVDDAGALKARGKAALREAQWFINAECQTSLHRLGKIVQVHTIVNVQGAGSRHSGKYYVTGVKHTIDAASHAMELKLTRNAWGNEGAGLNGIVNKIF
jgi:hypothetical protein